MKIFLLTHERELRRGTNTGSLAINNSNNIVERILWDRVNPNKALTRLIANNEAVLLYSKAKQSLDILSGSTSDKASINSRVLPSVSTGFTDSHFTRDMGIVSYGFNPIISKRV